MKLALEALEEINKLSIGENAICLPAEIDGAMDALRQRGWAPDYITLRRQHDLSPVTGPCAEPLVVLGAAKLGKTRLIDNLEV